MFSWSCPSPSSLCSVEPVRRQEAGQGRPDWKPLFDGKSLDGWKKSYDGGSGKVEVKDGAIVMERARR